MVQIIEVTSILLKYHSKNLTLNIKHYYIFFLYIDYLKLYSSIININIV